jgi:hypothetical protein
MRMICNSANSERLHFIFASRSAPMKAQNRSLISPPAEVGDFFMLKTVNIKRREVSAKAKPNFRSSLRDEIAF